MEPTSPNLVTNSFLQRENLGNSFPAHPNGKFFCVLKLPNNKPEQLEPGKSTLLINL